VKAEFENAAGLDRGADVRVGGVHRGTIRRIDLPPAPGGPVTVVIDLEASTRTIIKKDSIASIETEGLIGDKYLAVSFGSPQGTEIQDGDTIPSKRPLEISELIERTNSLLEGGQEAMKHINQATQGLGATMAEAKAGATNFKEDMAALKQN